MIFYLDLKRQLDHIEQLTKASHIKIMSAISDFKDQLAEYKNEILSGLNELTTGINAMKKKIEELQAGGLTPEEQAAILAGVAEVSDKIKALKELANEAPVVPPEA